ncbi:shikimate kinase [Paenibacillus sp. UNC496MF]|uniref:shikimate kinase n=1 Tax=Paenibacillus sp. UNC496MF TaxID=1502753 RepID=UPI0008F4043B|nr:shikimate kinase [Paenibacillus sp. UNC496MF]SFI28864.1 shikimate kinase [Paenibacillus sp. UNC496MF]
MSDGKPPRHVVLVGFMGTGKSTVSRRLAELLACGTRDVDAEIVKREGEEIAAIFAGRGEGEFRAAETEALRAVLGAEDALVVATGGGAVLSPINRELMVQRGFVVALTADPEQVIARVSQDPDRPLLQGDVRQRVYKLLEDRKGAYDFAHLTIDTTSLSVDEVVERIAQAISRFRTSQHSI